LTPVHKYDITQLISKKFVTGVITLATHVAMPNSVRICLQGVSELIDEIKEKKIKKYSMHWLRMNLLSRSLSD